MDVKEIKALIEAAKETEYAYIKIKNKDTVIELNKEAKADKQNTVPMVTPQMLQGMQQMPQVTVEVGNNAPCEESAVVTEATSVDTNDYHVVESPIVGTFYTAASPDMDAFVKVGDVVSTDQTLCIIEAMKLMNEIESGACGEVVEILVGNEDPVEYGQPLFKIRRA